MQYYSTSSVYRLLHSVLRSENGNLQNLALAKKSRVIDLLNRQSNNPFVWVYGKMRIGDSVLHAVGYTEKCLLDKMRIGKMRIE